MCATATLGSAIVTGNAWGFVVPYSVVDIRQIYFIPSVDFHGKAGINNNHEVVYTYLDGSDYIPFVYLPSSHYGFSAGVHELSGCSSSSAIPHDLNDSGQACGTANFGTSGARAALWTLSQGAVSCQQLDSAYSEAHALTRMDDSVDPPVTHVVGARVVGPCGFRDKAYGVRWLVDDGGLNVSPVAGSIWEPGQPCP